MGTDDELFVYWERQELRSKCLDRLLLTHTLHTQYKAQEEKPQGEVGLYDQAVDTDSFFCGNED